MTGLADPFDTAGLRARVLDAWAASPGRFREDANAEEDYALGGYRDRVVVELAQNAADAAVRGGVPGRLRLTLEDGVLTALNAGAPLDAAGAPPALGRADSGRDVLMLTALTGLAGRSCSAIALRSPSSSSASTVMAHHSGGSAGRRPLRVAHQRPASDTHGRQPGNSPAMRDSSAVTSPQAPAMIPPRRPCRNQRDLSHLTNWLKPLTICSQYSTDSAAGSSLLS